MVHLVVYDIADDPIRLRVAKYLEGKGRRVQESLFECDFPAAQIDLIAADLAALTKSGKSAMINIYPVCAECYSKTIGIGEVRQTARNRGYEIF